MKAVLLQMPLGAAATQRESFKGWGLPNGPATQARILGENERQGQGVKGIRVNEDREQR